MKVLRNRTEKPRAPAASGEASSPCADRAEIVRRMQISPAVARDETRLPMAGGEVLR